MGKTPAYHERELEVLEAPDGYVIRVFIFPKWHESNLLTPEAALKTAEKLRKKGHYRICFYASRIIQDEQRIANVTEKSLEELVNEKDKSTVRD